MKKMKNMTREEAAVFMRKVWREAMKGSYAEEAYEMAIKALEEPQWIPCSERLPNDSQQVLVYARSTHYALAKYDEMREADGTYKKQWVTFDAWKPFYTIKEVIAWMPLPEPWKEGDAE